MLKGKGFLFALSPLPLTLYPTFAKSLINTAVCSPRPSICEITYYYHLLKVDLPRVIYFDSSSTRSACSLCPQAESSLIKNSYIKVNKSIINQLVTC
jgi:hypothetical protein